MIWGPFLLALALGLIVSAGLYFAYLWPHIEPEEPGVEPQLASRTSHSGEPAKVMWPDRPADEEPEVPPPSVAG